MTRQMKQKTVSVRLRTGMSDNLRQIAMALSVIREEKVTVTDVADEFLADILEALAEKTRQQLIEYVDQERNRQEG